MTLSSELIRAGLEEMKVDRRRIEMHASTIAEMFLIAMRDAPAHRVKQIKLALRQFDALRSRWK